MITIEEYLLNPCSSLSIPYWKAKGMTVPPQIRIVHERDFAPELLEEYVDERYFRLRHDLQQISSAIPEGLRLETVQLDDVPLMADIINRSYTDLTVSVKQLEGYTQTPVYAPVL